MYSYKTRQLFYCQRNHAKNRGTKFEFTMQEWFTWWEQQLGSDWAKLRGCKKGQFQMTRKGDKGPYAVWNVECLTTTQNHQDQAKNGLAGLKKGHILGMGRVPCQNGIKITPEDAREIYTSKCPAKSLAIKYGISERSVHLIKNKEVWSIVLADL